MRTLFDPATLREVHLVAETDVFKALYFDRKSLALRPNLIFVDQNGATVFQTNEVGLKGSGLDRSRKLAVVWGDSVAFGSGSGWPCLLDEFAPTYQFLNGGLDGDPFINILRRAITFNQQQTVSLNLLMLGWHPFIPERVIHRSRPWPLLKMETAPSRLSRAGNENLRGNLMAFLQMLPHTVVLTMPTALNPDVIEDISPYLSAGDDETGFAFIGQVPYQPDGPRQAFEHITERNAVTREVCVELGIRLVDLFTAFKTDGLPDFRTHFYDILHLRPRSYRIMAQVIYEGIKDLLA